MRSQAAQRLPEILKPYYCNLYVWNFFSKNQWDNLIPISAWYSQIIIYIIFRHRITRETKRHSDALIAAIFSILALKWNHSWQRRRSLDSCFVNSVCPSTTSLGSEESAARVQELKEPMDTRCLFCQSVNPSADQSARTKYRTRRVLLRW